MTAWERNAANLAASLSFYGTQEDRGGVKLITSPVAYSVFNIALLSDQVMDWNNEIVQRIQTAAAHYQAHRRPWSFWVCENCLSGKSARRLNKLFADFRMEPIAEPPGMEADDLPPRKRDLPDLRFRQVDEPSARAAFARIVSECFNIPPSTAQLVYENEQIWKSPLTAFLAYREDEPVACAATISAAGALGIYSVATLREHRGQGIAEAIMRHATLWMRERGAAGPIVLQSSPAGLELYRKLGFKRTTRYFVFATI